MASSARLQSWVPLDMDTDFPLENLPYGAFTHPDFTGVHLGSALGSSVIDLHALAAAQLFGEDSQHLLSETLNSFMGAGKAAWRRVRNRLQSLFSAPASDEASAHMELLNKSLRPIS